MARVGSGRHVEGDSRSPRFDGRWRWLGHPAFFAVVCVLALNDHVLKDRYASWWTGKLSDFAGLAIAGTLAAVVIGPRRGPVLAGVAFVLLKTTPGVAEAARPILGGMTIRDEADLLALAVLVPLSLILLPPARLGHRAGSEIRRSRGANTRRTGARLSAGLSLVGAIFAVATATATSCAPGPAVALVATDGRVFYALIDRGWDPSKWARSADGGRTWQSIEGVPRGERASVPPHTPYEDPGPTGPLRACVAESTCWRLRDRRVIERQTRDGMWVEEFRLTDAEFSAVSTRCTGGQIGVMSSIAASEGPDGPVVIVSYGAEGVLVRNDDGRWVQTGVLSAAPTERASPLETAVAGGTLLLGPIVLATVIWLGRRRFPSWRRALTAIATGWAATALAAGVIAFWAGPDAFPTIVMARAGIVGMAVTAAVAVIVARRPVERPSELPPFIPERPDRPRRPSREG